ncbi:MAG TPA: DUF805 domain-containing protein [Reyranella sp.]|nr:DUF805 domain-containing protein [Reyranella sp.]
MQALLFSFQGRVNRAKFWLVAIVATVVVSIVIGIVFGGMAAGSNSSNALGAMGVVGGIIVAVVYILLLWINLAVAVKRCHDRNRSGWFVLLSLVPFLNIWYIVEVGFLKGTTGPNTYGPDPLAAG